MVGVTSTKQQALWVYAHPDGRSFNRQLFVAGRAELGKTHDVVTTSTPNVSTLSSRSVISAPTLPSTTPS